MPSSAAVVGGEVKLPFAWPDCGRAVKTSSTSLSCMSANVGDLMTALHILRHVVTDPLESFGLSSK